MFTLIGLGVAVACGCSVAVVGCAPGYVESAAVIVTLVLLGLHELRARSRTSSSV